MLEINHILNTRQCFYQLNQLEKDTQTYKTNIYVAWVARHPNIQDKYSIHD